MALELSRDVVNLFVDAPPFEARAGALSAAFDRVLAGNEVTRLHVAGDYDADRGLLAGRLPHRRGARGAAGAGRPRGGVHARAGGTRPGPRGPVRGRRRRRGLPAAAGSADPGHRVHRGAGPGRPESRPGRAATSYTAFAAARDGFDRRAWLTGNTEWLVQAVHQGEVTAARAWATAATQVSVQLAGVLANAPWPELQIPDLGAFFDALDAEPLTAAVVVTPEPELEPEPEPAATEEAAADELPEPLTFEDDPLGEMESLIGLESVKDAVRRMVAETKADLAPQGARPAGARAGPAHGVRRQARYREDDGGPVAQPDLQGAGHPRQGARGRGRPVRPGRRRGRQHRADDRRQVPRGDRRRAVHR